MTTRPVAARSTRRRSSSRTAQTPIAPHRKIGRKVAFEPASATKVIASATQTPRGGRRSARSTSKMSISAGIDIITP
jgi:hypothetical protein